MVVVEEDIENIFEGDPKNKGFFTLGEWIVLFVIWVFFFFFLVGLNDLEHLEWQCFSLKVR